MCGICSEFSILPFIPEILGGKGRPDGEFRVFPCFAALVAKAGPTHRALKKERSSSFSLSPGISNEKVKGWKFDPKQFFDSQNV